MQRAVPLLVLAGVVGATVAAGSARASGVGAATTATTTTTTTTTTATTTGYAPLAPSSLPAGCVGAGSAAVVLTAHPVIAFGTPAADLGPSAYYTAAGPVVAFASSTSSGSSCASADVTLSSVSLFYGAVSATSVQARDGKGIANGLEIDGTPVTATEGQTVPVEGWGELTLGGTAGRVTAPLVVHLLQAHDSLPAGATIAVGFAASAAAVPKTTSPHGGAHARKVQAPSQPAKKSAAKRHAARRPPAYPATRYPFLVDGRLGPVASRNPVVAIAIKYLGVPYRWGGAGPDTGFDCSGLVKYVFAKLGISLPHFAAAQWASPDAVWVSPSRLQPGDLVFFTGSDGTRKAPGHVGIYVGDGYLIDAPHTGAYVQIDRLDEKWFARNFVGAKRILGVPLTVPHLAQLARRVTFRTVDAVGFAPPPALDRVGEPLDGAAAGADVLRAASRGYRESPGAAVGLVHLTGRYGIWAGAGLGGVLLVLLAGTAAYRRRERRPEAAVPDPSS